MPASGPTVSLVQRLRVSVEPAGSFAVDRTGTLANFSDVPMVEGSAQLTLTQETHNPQQALQNMLDYQEEVIGKKTWTLNFSTPFAPTGVAAGSAVAATVGSIQTLMKTVMGGEFKGTGSTAATGGWATAGGGNVASGAGFRAGGVAGWRDSSGVLHLRPVRQVSSNTVSLKVRFPSAPASGDVIYSGATYFWTQDPDTSLQFIVEGYEQQDRWVLLGGQGTVTPQLALDGTIQQLQWAITGVNWLEADEAAGASNLHATNISAATYSRFDPITGQSGRLLVQTVGTLALTGASVDASEVSFAPGGTYVQVPSPSGVNGVVRHRLTRASGTPMVSGTFSSYFTGYGRWDDRDTKADKLVFYQCGVTEGKAVAVEAPTVQLTDVQRNDQAGLAGEQVSFKGRVDTGTTEATASDLGRSPHRYHFA